MEKKVIRSLNWSYYGVMVLTLLAGTLAYFLVIKGYVTPIDKMSVAGKTLQYVVILDALCTIPLGLYWFKRRCKALCQMEDGNEKLSKYQRIATLRIWIVSNAMVPGIVVFYLMGCYQPMLWVTAIAAIGWYFTKPTLRKMELELQPQDPAQENY